MYSQQAIDIMARITLSVTFVALAALASFVTFALMFYRWYVERRRPTDVDGLKLDQILGDVSVREDVPSDVRESVRQARRIAARMKYSA